VARVFATLGLIGFGGPAAHTALMRREVVERRGWLDDRRFLDLVAITNLLPGPNSTELAIYLGRLRAGWPGLLIGGAAFIVPAAAIVLGLAWAYVEYGTTPSGEALLYGVKPVVVAIVAAAIWELARSGLRGPVAPAIAVGVLAGYLVGVHELLLIAAGALLAVALRGVGLRGMAPVPPALRLEQLAVVADVRLADVFLIFLKIGAVLYGSGYVLVAFLRADLVERLGWLTDRQLLDAVAIGQVTPGPLFTTATFVGYLVAGIPGAALATLAIFLPAFVFVAVAAPLAERLRDRPLTSALLDGLVAASLGLMAAVTIQLGGEAIRDPFTALLAVAALVTIAVARINSAWLVLAGAAAGLAAASIGAI
jgi:chromate transporter